MKPGEETTVPEHLVKTDFGEDILMEEVESNEVLAISLDSSEASEKAVVRLADFLGEAKRLSGRLCSMLSFKQN